MHLFLREIHTVSCIDRVSLGSTYTEYRIQPTQFLASSNETFRKSPGDEFGGGSPSCPSVCTLIKPRGVGGVGARTECYNIRATVDAVRCSEREGGSYCSCSFENWQPDVAVAGAYI